MAPGSTWNGVPLNPGTSLRIRGESRVFTFNFLMMVFVAAMGVIVLVAGALEKNGTTPLVTGTIISAFSLPLVLLILVFAFRPIAIGDGLLRVPTFRGTTVIPLDQIAGVGLIYQFTPGSRAPVGWQLRVWNGDKVVAINRWIVAAWRNYGSRGTKTKRKKGFIFRRDWNLPLPHENSSYLAATKPGQVARLIYESVLAWQGPNGALAAKAMEKTISYDPNTMNQTAAWWSPDGTMGRARGLPEPDLTRFPTEGPEAVGKPRRLLGVLVALTTALVFSLVAGGVWNVDQATAVSHPDGAQIAIIVLGAVVLTGGLVLSVFFGVRLWRGRRRLATVGQPPVAEADWASRGSPGNPVTSDFPTRGAATQIPQVRPEVRQARRRNALLALASLPIFVLAGVITALMLGRVGHIPNGETCAAVLGPPSPHPSLACDAWRHHQLVVFFWPATLIILGFVVIVILQFKAIRNLSRVTRAGSASV